jgi:hypothetical protein
VSAFRAALIANGEGEDAVAAWIEAAPLGWDHPSGVARMSHVVFVDGEVAGVGLVTYGRSASLLAGSALLPRHRGRRAYRALIASRWEAAVAMGKPALAVHAGAMSRPILERCGFEARCRIDVLLDPAVGSSGG